MDFPRTINLLPECEVQWEMRQLQQKIDLQTKKCML